MAASEQVVIVTDAARLHVAEAVRSEAAEAGGEVVVVAFAAKSVIKGSDVRW